MTALTKRTTIYINPGLYKALKLKALETECSLSELVNEAIVHELSEDAADLAEFEKRKNEPSVSFDSFVKELKRSGKI